MAELKHTEDSSASGVCRNCNNHIREKLVELMNEADDQCAEMACSNCGYVKNPVHCKSFRFADHLLANGVTVQEWIPVTEPPKAWRRENGDMVNYLVYVPEFGVDIGNYAEPAKCWLCMGIPCKPTHWAYLPQPPKGE